MDHILNTKCNRKHCTLEALIKKEDVAQDMSRAAMFERFTIAAENVEDWSVVATMLGSIKTGSDDPNFTNYQARYSDDTAERLEKIKDTMVRSLKDGGNITKVLQTQFMLQLLMMNYLDHLKKEKLKLKSSIEEDISLPEMAKILTEMMLTDKDCAALQEIRAILIKYRTEI